MGNEASRAAGWYYRSTGRRSFITLVVTGSLVAVALVAFGIVSGVVAFALR